MTIEFGQQFLNVFTNYFQDLWLSLAIGFILSGFFYTFIPGQLVENYLGKKGWKAIFLTSLVGVILPVCCVGSLPIALTLKRKGATLGCVLAFLIATPATSISAILVCYKLMGLVFTLYMCGAVILMAWIIGFCGNFLKIEEIEFLKSEDPCCEHEESRINKKRTFLKKIWASLRYAFIVLPKEIGFEVLVGIAIASIITIYEPAQNIIHEHLTGVAGYAFITVIGLLTYVCSTASVPLADALIQGGMSYGQALCYLLVGPITSYGTILVIRKDFGGKVLAVYLSLIIVLSVFYGVIYDLYIG